MRRETIRALVVALLFLSTGCSGRGGSNAITYPGVSGHKWLPLAGTVHDPSAQGTTVHCESCHGGNTFAQFDCIGCHKQPATDPVHAGVAGYTWTSAGCYECHPDGAGTMPDHGRFFPIGQGTKHALQCSRCHGDPLHRTDLTTLKCASCHGAIAGFSTRHAGVKDFSAESPACARCHGDAQVDRVAGHTAFPIASGSATHDTACLRCHDANRTGDKSFAVDFSKENCLGCHTDPTTTQRHSGVTGYVYATASCLTCHPSGSAAPSNHGAAFFPIGTGSAHDGVGCQGCHTDLTHPNDPSAFACATCHAAISGFSTKHAPIGGVAIVVRTSCAGGNSNTTPVAMTPASCLACHADGQVTRVSDHLAFDSGNSQLLRSDHRPAGCVTCHAVMRTDKPFGIDFTLPGTGAQRGSTGCATCHDNGCGGD